jgi:hypothetical protein
MDLRIIQPPANIFIDPFADTGGARARSVNDEIADLEKMIEKTKRVEEMQPKNPGQPNPGNVANPNAMMGVQPDTLKMLERELRALKAEAAEKGPVEDAGTHLAQP